MGIEFFRYHPERAPAGRIFNTADHSPEMLAEDGWVDTPTKFGFDPTGHMSQAALAEKQRRFQGSGGTDGGLTFDQLQRKYADETEARLKDQEEASRAIDERDALIESLRTQLSREEQARQAAERAADEAADAVRGQASADSAAKAARDAAAQEAAKPADPDPAPEKPPAKPRATRTRKTPAKQAPKAD